jgi:tRNA pseudouridine55 synthase
VIVDKPRGPTSHDVVARARKAFQTREVGHAGTLDPMASGVLVLGIREGTKLLAHLTAHEKTYETTVLLGETTETLDAEGLERTRADVPMSLRTELSALASSGASSGARTVVAPESALGVALAGELARTLQAPPIYSAIQKDGERAHDLARSGREVVLEPRTVRVHEIEVLSATVAPEVTVTVRIRADKGYYVRAFGRDLALALGTVGHLIALRRLASGPFRVDEATALDALPSGLLALPEAARRAMPALVLDAGAVIEARHGKPVRHPSIAEGPEGPCAWLDDRGALVAIGARSPEGHGKVVRGFVPPAP